MRNTVAHTLLAVFVVTLAISNMLLADKLSDMQNEIPALAVKLASYESSPTPTPVPLSLSELIPDYGPVGTQVTIRGSGFLPTGNKILFDYHEITAGSFDGTTLSFVVPEFLHYPCPDTGACPTNDWQAVVPHTYAVSVKVGATISNALTFAVTPTSTNIVKIRSLKPTSGIPGTVVTINGTGFARTGNTVYFGYHQIANLRSSGTNIKFTVPKYLTFPCTDSSPCPTSATRITAPGTYRISVSNARGTSNAAVFTVKPTPTPKPSPR